MLVTKMTFLICNHLCFSHELTRRMYSFVGDSKRVQRVETVPCVFQSDVFGCDGSSPDLYGRGQTRSALIV